MAPESYLAFDLGASSGRAVIGRFDGARLDLEEIHRFPNRPMDIEGRLHWDLPRILEEVKEGLRLATTTGPELTAVGIDTWGVDFGLLDARGELIATPYCYRDPGVDGMMEFVLDRVPKEDLYRRTGVQLIPINSLYRLLSISREHPDWLHRSESLLMIPDLLNFWLTGTRCCEFTNATTTQFYNPTKQGWDDDLLEQLDIPTHFLPEIVPPGTALGSLKPEIAADSGLSKLTIVAPATHDTGSAVAAVPFAHASGFDAFISCGTWALVGCELDRTVLSTEALTHNFTNEGGVAGTWRFLKNVAGLWLLEECRREWGETADYDVLEEEARGSSPFQSLIDPDEPGFVLPGDMTTRIRSFCRKTGQAEPNSRGEFVRCILESLALKFLTVLDDVETITGESLRNVHIVGGGCRNRLLCEWTAAASGKPVLAGPAEATALGNLLVQAMAVGRIDSLADARAVVANSVDVQIYEPGPRQPWEDVRDRFRSLWDA